MRGTKGIHHKNIANLRHASCQCFIVGFFTRQKAHIFKQGDLSGLDIFAVVQLGQKRYRCIKQLAQPLGDRRQRRRCSAA